MDYQLLLMCCAALLAGFVDSIVGGGGLVQVPALFILYPHFEIPRIIGTNRFSSFMGTAVAGYQYSKKVEIPWRTVIYAGIWAGIMAFLGAKISDIVDEKILTCHSRFNDCHCYLYFYKKGFRARRKTKI